MIKTAPRSWEPGLFWGIRWKNVPAPRHCTSHDIYAASHRLLWLAYTRSWYFGDSWCAMVDWLFFSLSLQKFLSWCKSMDVFVLVLSQCIGYFFSPKVPFFVLMYGRFRPCFVSMYKVIKWDNHNLN